MRFLSGWGLFYPLVTIFELFSDYFTFTLSIFPQKIHSSWHPRISWLQLETKKREKERENIDVSLCSTKKLKKGTNKLLNPQKYVTRQRTINTHWNPIFLNLFSFFCGRKSTSPIIEAKERRKPINQIITFLLLVL